MKASVDKSGCIGCGLCEGICPSVFRMTDEGVAEVYAELSRENESEAREAAAGCPVEVITITDQN